MEKFGKENNKKNEYFDSMYLYKAKVKYHGNHYFSGQTVRGSKVKHKEDGSIWLFDDEIVNIKVPSLNATTQGFSFEEQRNTWVEVTDLEVDNYDG